MMLFFLFLDMYVKVYLVGGFKVIQKKKMYVVKGFFCLFFRCMIKYFVCNIYGRVIKVNILIIFQIIRFVVGYLYFLILFCVVQIILWVWYGVFDKKQFLGEVVVKFDGFDLMYQFINWYKLFLLGVIDFGFNEFFYFW